jgi:hypothetical protein
MSSTTKRPSSSKTTTNPIGGTTMRLHAKYGLTPTMPVCFYCGEEIGEIVLLGASYKGEAPNKMVMNLEPCDKCKELYKGRLLVVSVDNENNPTGEFFAINKQVISDEFQNHPVALMPSKEFNLIKERSDVTRRNNS